MIFATLVVVGRLFVFQIIQGDEWADRAYDIVSVVDNPERGVIYDSSGASLAVSEMEYQPGVSPSLVYDSDEEASELAPILGIPRYELLEKLNSDAPYEQIGERVSSDVAEQIRAMTYNDGLQLDPYPRRFYPQDELMCHVLGYTVLNNQGGGGVEGFYDRELTGQAASAETHVNPLYEQPTVMAREGADLVLTIDRSVQFLVEQQLKAALVEHGAVSGTIIVMNPRTGAILAMASEPCFSPNHIEDAKQSDVINPIVSQQYEPGSVMKLITMAAALDSKTVTPTTTYNDTGAFTAGGATIYNWDRGAYGVTDMQTLLARSLNVGAATIANWMGSDVFYDYFQRFGFGRPTGIDIAGEAGGTLFIPNTATEADQLQIATNSYGQGMATTPLQMISAVSALANNGYLMQPYVVQEIRDSSGVQRHEPTVLSQPISADTAHVMTNMAVNAVAQEVPEAQLPGYTVAGKTGTAQIYENGMYNPVDIIGSFIGWLPADDPEIIVLVKLDRPTSAPWGSMTAAPTFAKLAAELVVALNIPPDEIRLQTDIAAARGGN